MSESTLNNVDIPNAVSTKELQAILDSKQLDQQAAPSNNWVNKIRAEQANRGSSLPDY